MKAKPTLQVVNAMQRMGIASQEILLSLATDINGHGKYDEQWLVATDDTLYIFDFEQSEVPLWTLPLKQVEAFRTNSAVGSGFLQARLVGGVWVNLLRFSNRLQFFFEQGVGRLEEIRSGRSVSPIEEADPQRCPNCNLMLEFAGEICPRCINHGAALSRVSQMIRPYWKQASALLVLLFIGITLDLAWPLLTKFLVDYVLKEDHPPFAGFYARFASYSPIELLTFVVGGLASVHVIRAVVNVLTARIAGRVGNSMTFDIRSQLVRKLEQLGLAYYNKQETGSLVGRVAYDTDAIHGFISQITSGFVMQFLLVIFSFIMMLSLEWHLALWAMLPAPFVIGGSYIYWRYVHPRYERFWDRSAKQAGVLNGILSGIRVVKAFAREEYELERFEKVSDSVRGSKNSLDLSAAFFYPFMGIVFQVGGWIIWYVGGMSVLQREISLGTLMAFFGYLSMFYGPLGNLTNLTTWLTQFSTQMHRILEILDAPAVIPEAREPVAIQEPRGEIELRDVSFAYTRGSPVLKHLNMKVNPGEKIGIVGRSGSGKTSLINLIYRFYDVDSGEILIDGVDIRSLSKEEHRKQISIVLQEAFLFQGTLSENISYGHMEANKEEVIAAAKAANCHEFVLHHSLAYDTTVGERGQELSGGERQRISIARALLRDAPILILDEATSAIDSESELLIQTALEETTRKRTVLIIAHRLSTLQGCDRIYVLDNGTVAESGSHRELMAKDGLYSRWVKIQQGQTSIENIEKEEAPRLVPKRKPGSPLPALEGHRARWLYPEFANFSRGGKNEIRLEIKGEGEYRGVFTQRCYPIEDPDRYLSIRWLDQSGQSKEVGIVKSLNDWPESTQALLRNSLTEYYLFHRVEKIYSIKKLSQFLSIDALTNLGRVDFLVRYSSDNVKNYGNKGKILVDVEDNLYLVPNVDLMPRQERSAFHRYIYW